MVRVLAVVFGLGANVLVGASLEAQIAAGVPAKGSPGIPGPPSPSPSGPQPLGPGTILIDFDGETQPCFFIETNALRDELAPLGLHFDGPAPNDGGAILDECGTFQVMGHSSPNFLAFNSVATMMNGGIPRGPETISFDFPITSFGLLAGSGLGPSGTVTVEAFDSDGTLVDTDSTAVLPDLQPLQVDGAGITTVVVSFDTQVMVLDDLFFVPDASAGFRRGDANDDSVVDISDVIFVLASLFVSGAPSPGCQKAADVNDDSAVDVSDPIYLLDNLFGPGPPPPPPFPGCGVDPTGDPLTCDIVNGCP